MYKNVNTYIVFLFLSHQTLLVVIYKLFLPSHHRGKRLYSSCSNFKLNKDNNAWNKFFFFLLLTLKKRICVKLETERRHQLNNKRSDFSCKSKSYDVDELCRLLNILLFFLCQTCLKIKYSYQTLSFVLDFCFECVVARYGLRGIIKISIIRRQHDKICVTIAVAKASYGYALICFLSKS